ncbi:hypothetical protein FE633_44025 [Streptomyces montanus]|uniref:Uncharacterized protein n=1 Tax=Streptomyces montanus TaxID=2580423 RepID=A0A5R9FBV9_9ACTN|nr:hypothetical protein FE633_44025 [Streptomyces montanus]
MSSTAVNRLPPALDTFVERIDTPAPTVPADVMRDNVVFDSSRLGTVGEPEEVQCSAMGAASSCSPRARRTSGLLGSQTQKKDTP